MNYLKIYNQLINKRRLMPISPNQIGENHHIIPKCMGGTDNIENIIRLTPKEHFIAHALLYYQYKTPALAYAWNSMRRTSNNQNRKLTSIEYNLVKKHFSEVVSYRQKNKTEKEIKNWVEKVASKPKSKEHRRKIGKKGLVMMQNIYTKEIIRDIRENYDTKIWVNPKKINPEKRYKCKYCDCVTTKSNLKRWHDDNCKFKSTGIYINPSEKRKTDRKIIPIKIDGIEYRSMRQAEIKTGKSKYEIQRIAKSQIF